MFPSDPGALEFLLPSTRTPAVVGFTGPDGRQTAHYMLKWPSTRGEAGPLALDGISRVERGGMRDVRGVEAGSFQPSAIGGRL